MTKDQVCQTLSTILVQVMELEPGELDTQASLLDMGLSSLALVEALRRVQDTFGIRPSARTILEQYWTVERCADYILELLQQGPEPGWSGTEAGVPQATDVFHGPTTSLPCTAGQKQLGFLGLLSEGAAMAYRETVLLVLQGDLDLGRLQEALNAVVQRHAALRTRLVVESLSQEVAAAAHYDIERADFAGLPLPEAQREATAWLAAYQQRAAAREAPLAVAALRIEPRVHLLAVVAASALADRQALHLLLSEMGHYYTAHGAQETVPLAAPQSYEAYVTGQEGSERSGALHREETYWLAQFQDGIPRVELPADATRPPLQSYQGSRLVVPLSAPLVQALRQHCTQSGTTLYALCLGAFSVLVQRLVREPEVVLGVSGRAAVFDQPDEPLVAPRTNLLPFRLSVDGTQPWEAFQHTVHAALTDLSVHANYPSALLVQRLNPERDLARSPLFVVAYEAEIYGQPPRFAELSAAYVTPPSTQARYDLHLTLQDLAEGIQLQCDYNTDIVRRDTVRRWMACLSRLLSALVEAPETPVARLPILPEEDRAALAAWQATGAEFSRRQCLHHLFEAQAAQRPEAIAVRCGDLALSYRRLDQCANQLAQRLRRMGVGPNVPVGICIERSLEMLVGLLGILKAGGAYVPLEPSYPAERLRLMVSDARAPVVLTSSRWRAQLPAEHAEILALDAEASRLAGESMAPVVTAVQPTDLAYIIYTSGSTGVPKGVEVPHLGVVNIVQDCARVHALGAEDVITSVTSMSFDIFVTEAFLAFAVGGRLVLVPDEITTDGSRLAALLNDSGTTYFQATPATWQMLLDHGWPGLPSLTAVSGGEALTEALAAQLLPRCQVLWNGYGPTEATIWTTRSRVTPGEPITIGRAVANAQVHVLDQELQPVPIGVPGELCIGGVGVARGYLRRPELTAEKFVPDPFSATPGARLYRTGDLVRYLPQGDIEFWGRLDHQIKLRGYRIELGEIDAHLQRHPQVRAALTVARPDDPGGPRLVSYIVPTGVAPGSAELRQALQRHLPAYMIPAAYVMLEAFPLNTSGKIDRRALPAPHDLEDAAATQAYTPPSTPVETFLAQTWSAMLGLPQVGIHDDFFALGGHSLLISQMVVQIRETFNVGVGPRDFFDTPTIAQLGAVITGQGAQSAMQPAPDRRVGLRSTRAAVAERYRFLLGEARLEPEIQPHGQCVPTTSPERILLTGATGFVGAYLLRELLDRSAADIYCLVRAPGPEAALRRIETALRQWGLWYEQDAARLRVVLGDVTQPYLGLTPAAFTDLGEQLDLIVHSAAMVKFLQPYRVLKRVNVDGTREMARLACAGRTTPLHYVSTAAVVPMGQGQRFMEEVSPVHEVLLNIAYDETKWVAEHMLGALQQRGVPVAIYRMGEICGDSRTGQSVFDHMVFAFFKGALQLQAFPALDASLDLVPVDYVSKALAHIALRPDAPGRIYHLNNPTPTTPTRAYEFIWGRGYEFAVLPYEPWRRTLLTHARLTDNALYPYVGLFEEFEERNLEFPAFDCRHTEWALRGSDIHCTPTQDLLSTIFDFFCNVGFFPLPTMPMSSATHREA